MIPVPTNPAMHYVGDVAAWVAAALSARWQHRHWPDLARRLSLLVEPGYFVSLGLGALIGAWTFGSANSLRSLVSAPSHSIAGALAGGIIAVELWKWRHGVRASTGNGFVLPIAIGIAIGRLGCLFAGLPDYTYGTPTSVPWAVDLGDGIGRHPVQLYESIAMAGFFAVYLAARRHDACWSRTVAFQVMIMVYAVQRFAWEFLKPYPPLLGPLNIYHVLMIGMLVYGFVWCRRYGRSAERAA